MLVIIIYYNSIQHYEVHRKIRNILQEYITVIIAIV